MIDTRHCTSMSALRFARRATFTLACVCMSALTTGCQTTDSKPAPSRAQVKPAAQTAGEPNVNTDPTAVHLHDLAGQLLLFHFKHGRLPRKLSELESPDRESGPSRKDTTDPATGQTYAYSPDSQAHAGLNGRVIVYQSVPTNPAGRWALLVGPGQEPDRLILYVARVPEPLLGAATRP